MTFTDRPHLPSDFIRLTHSGPRDDLPHTFAWDTAILNEVLTSGHDVVIQTKDGFANLTEMVRHFAAKAEAEKQRWIDTINELCTCGGKGPHDKGVCPACLIFHKACGRTG